MNDCTSSDPQLPSVRNLPSHPYPLHLGGRASKTASKPAPSSSTNRSCACSLARGSIICHRCKIEAFCFKRGMATDVNVDEKENGDRRTIIGGFSFGPGLSRI